MSNPNAVSGENDHSAESIREEFLKDWGKEDGILSSPTQEDDESDETDDVSEDATLSDDADEDETVEQTDTDDVEPDGDDAEDVPEARYADDNDKIKYRFNGEDFELSVADAKKFAGQERAIDHRMKDVVANEKKATEVLERAETAGEEMYTRSLTRYNQQWKDYDWAKAFKDLPSHDFNNLRALHDSDYNDVGYYAQSLDKVVADRRQQVDQARTRELNERSARVVKELSDPATGIPDFSEAKLAEIGRYAMAQGIPQERMSDAFETPLLRMIEKARLYDLSQTVKSTPVVKTASKITKQKVNVETTRSASNGTSAKRAQAELDSRGGKEAAIKAIMADWSSD